MIARNITCTLQENKGYYVAAISYYDENNKRKQTTRTTGYKVEKGNKRPAQARVKEIEEDFNNSAKIAQESSTNKKSEKQNCLTLADIDFYEYMHWWLENVSKKQVERDTYNGYRGQIEGNLKRYFIKEENKKRVKDITFEDLETFYSYLYGKGLKNGTVDHYNDNINSAFKYLLRKKLIGKNPTDLVEPIPVDTFEVNPYTETELLNLLEIIKGNILEVPILLGATYGLRRSEFMGLRWSAIDFEENYFKINHVAIQTYGKDMKEKIYFKNKAKSSKGNRELPLFDIVKESLIRKKEIIEKNKEFFGNTYNHKYDDYVCVKDNGDIISPNYITKTFPKILKNNNLRKIRVHDLRHSVGTLLHRKGADIRQIQEWLGHCSIASTNRYTRTDFQTQKKTGTVIAEVFDNKNIS